MTQNLIYDFHQYLNDLINQQLMNFLNINTEYSTIPCFMESYIPNLPDNYQSLYHITDNVTNILSEKKKKKNKNHKYFNFNDRYNDYLRIFKLKYIL